MSKAWAGGKEIKELRQLVIDTYGIECHICHELIDISKPAGDPYSMHLDHVVPRKYGGSNHIDNLRPAHAICNMQKGAKLETHRRRRYRNARFF